MLRLKELRLSAELTQIELARKIGVNQTAVGKYERGELEPGIETLKKLSQIFECSIDYIVGNTDDFGNVTVKGNGPVLSPEEKKLIETYRALNVKNKMHVESYATIRLEEQDDGPSFA